MSESKTCHGCGRRNTREVHCQYPSNPLMNALIAEKQMPKSNLPEVVRRRNRANAISLANKRANLMSF